MSLTKKTEQCEICRTWHECKHKTEQHPTEIERVDGDWKERFEEKFLFRNVVKNCWHFEAIDDVAGNEGKLIEDIFSFIQSEKQQSYLQGKEEMKEVKISPPLESFEEPTIMAFCPKNCGLTAGCQYCNGGLRKIYPNPKESFIGIITDQEAAEMIEKLNAWKERFDKDFSKRKNW